MNELASLEPKPKSSAPEIRVALVFAGLMLATAAVARLAPRFGWIDTASIQQRSLMILLAAYIVLTGNTIPKRLTSLACVGMNPARTQSFFRFAGWTWVLAGLAFGAAWLALPLSTAGTTTLVVLPLAIAAVAIQWLRHTAAPPPAA